MYSMGVNLEHWRGSIGLFHGKIICNTTCLIYRYYDDFFIINEVSSICSKFVGCLPVQLFIGVLLAFCYCTMAIIMIPPFLPGYYLYDMFWNTVTSSRCSSAFCCPCSRLMYAFLVISHKIKVAVLFFRKSLSIEIKKILFFIIVWQVLLVLSGTVETNAGPDNAKKTKLTFAVWNLDSIPARDYARIPLIETFQAAYDFDIFGVCESFLDDKISN